MSFFLRHFLVDLHSKYDRLLEECPYLYEALSFGMIDLVLRIADFVDFFVSNLAVFVKQSFLQGPVEDVA